jgi:hypothetical protein
VYRNNAAYQVEFVTGGGQTVAISTLLPEEIRPFRNREILHTQQLTPG